METGPPGSDFVTVRASPEAEDDLRRVFGELGLPTSGVLEHSAAEVLSAIFDVQNVLGSTAGLAVFVKGLSVWLHRNDGKEIDLTVNGKKLKVKGISEAGIARFLQAEWGDQWHSTARDQFPAAPGDEPQ